MRLLVIEDEKRLARNLAELLRRQGYTVDVSSDGVSGYDNASTDLYDLILLDAMLPGMDGFSLLRKLRAGGHAVPVLMLTARSDLSDRVQGLDCGADYYLTKPFEPEELLACVRSLLRRGGGDARTDDAITFGDLRLEPGTFQLSCGERSLRLSRREYDMLELLLRSQGRVVPKEQLLLKVWGYDSDAEDNNVEVYISFLRRKLTHLHSAVTIRTRRMVGYFLAVMFYMDILRYIIGRDYWPGLRVVPIVMAAEIFMGIYFNLSFWYKLIDETRWGAYFSLIGCTILVVMNVLLIPKYSYMACAWAGFCGYGVAMLLSYFVGQKKYPIQYDLKSIGAYVLLAAALYVAAEYVPIDNVCLRMVYRTVLLLVFVAYIVKCDLPLGNIPIVGRLFRK